MATIERFEDIEAWQKAREITREIYAVSKGDAFARDFGLKDQIRRAAVSIMSNIAEGFERGGDKEFAQFIALAKGSSAEVRSQLYVALDQGYIDHDTFDRLAKATLQINRMLSGLMKYLRNSDYKGSKFR
ncbi:four helix bundle protein [Dissulfurirhabdus thermomarina]|uniref:Four helix bundle protein n=1 Tax=Dissulfurirhabdus thermomarina TaxID=1765737 RepID=A0A6N9TLJ4_DISTH|nr:four helix bundle protein [Dissulfurirhabdus thermomarina]NDY41989.1 four helix bundle protein [Dissulfurirhabdus thermomarina]NMX23462.1 four helix bundle protein [Dissulfurirhabdus thermomarina]